MSDYSESKKEWIKNKLIEKSKVEFWIDRSGFIHKLDLEEWINNHLDQDIISFHYEIIRQKFPAWKDGEVPNKLGWITYGSISGSRNRYDIEPSQAQINTLYKLKNK